MAYLTCSLLRFSGWSEIQITLKFALKVTLNTARAQLPECFAPLGPLLFCWSPGLRLPPVALPKMVIDWVTLGRVALCFLLASCLLPAGFLAGFLMARSADRCGSAAGVHTLVFRMVQHDESNAVLRSVVASPPLCLACAAAALFFGTTWWKRPVQQLAQLVSRLL